MNIEIGDSKQLIAMAHLGMEVYRSLKSAGVLKELGEDLLAVGNALSRQTTANDVHALKAYMDAGMSSEQAVQILLARKVRTAAKTNEFLEKLSKA